MDHSPRTRRKRFNEYWKRREAARRAGEPIPSVFDEFPNLFGSTTKINNKQSSGDWEEFEEEMQAFEKEMQSFEEEMFAFSEQSNNQKSVRSNMGYETYSNGQDRQNIISSAKSRFTKSINSIEKSRKDAADTLAKLGRWRIAAWAGTMQPFARAYARFSLEELDKESNKLSRDENWDPYRFLDVVDKSSTMVDTIQKSDEGAMDAGQMIAVAAFGGPLLFCNASPNIILRTIEEVTQKNGAVAWLSGNATTDNYSGIVSKLVIIGLDFLPFMSLMKSRQKTFSQKIPLSQAESFSQEVNKVAEQLDAARQQIDSIQAITEKYLNFTEALRSNLNLLLKEVFAIEKDYSKREGTGKIPMDDLSEVERKTVLLAWAIGQELVDLLVIPILIESGTVDADAQRKLKGFAKRCNQFVEKSTQLQTEKNEIATLLEQSKSVVSSVQNEFRTAKEQLKDRVIRFADFKSAVWNEQLKTYISSISEYDGVRIDQDILGTPMVCAYDTAMPIASKIMQRVATVGQGDDIADVNANKIEFAVNSIAESNGEDRRFSLWIYETEDLTNKVDGVGKQEFLKLAEPLATISGKESLKQAQGIYETVSKSSQGILSVNAKMQELISVLDAYEITIGNVIKQFQPIANSVVSIGELHKEHTSFDSLTGQEQITISISWEYAQLLIKMLTDSFYVSSESRIFLNAEVPQGVESRLKVIRKAALKLSGESAYAVNSLWEKSAKKAEWIGFGVVALLVVLGIVTTVLISAVGLLFIPAAAVAFPIFFVKKDLPLNKLTFWRWVRIIGAGVLAIVIAVLLFI